MSEILCYRCTTPLILDLETDRYTCKNCGIREDYQAYVARTRPGPWRGIYVALFLGTVLSLIIVILALALKATF